MYSSKLKICVTGASGFVGRALCKKLINLGHEVTGIYHKNAIYDIDGVYPVCLDLENTPLLAAPLKNANVVVHLAWDGGFQSSLNKKDETLRYSESKNLTMIKSVLRACHRESVPKVIYLSALNASKKSQTDFLKEKYLSEVEFVNSDVSKRVIIKSDLVFDKKINHLNNSKNNLLDLVAKKRMLPCFDEERQLSPVDLESVINTITYLCEKDLPSPCLIYRLTNASKLKMNDVLQKIKEQFDPRFQLSLKGYFADLIMDRHYRQTGFNLETLVDSFAQKETEEKTQLLVSSRLGLKHFLPSDINKLI